MIRRRLLRLLRPQRWWAYPLYLPVLYLGVWLMIFEWIWELFLRKDQR